MKAVIKVTNGFGQTEYFKEYGGWTKYIDDAQIYDVESAESIVKGAKESKIVAPIWNTARVVYVRITEI